MACENLLKIPHLRGQFLDLLLNGGGFLVKRCYSLGPWTGPTPRVIMNHRVFHIEVQKSWKKCLVEPPIWKNMRHKMDYCISNLQGVFSKIRNLFFKPPSRNPSSLKWMTTWRYFMMASLTSDWSDWGWPRVRNPFTKKTPFFKTCDIYGWRKNYISHYLQGFSTIPGDCLGSLPSIVA